MKEEYSIKVKDLPEEEKPREKLKKYGPNALKNYELLSIILGKGTIKEDVFGIAKRVIDEYGSRAITTEADVEKVKKILEIGDVHACQVVACFELGRRFFSQTKEVYIRTPEDAFKYLSEMKKLNKEHFRGLYLDVKNKVIRDEVISIGTLTTNLIHPREIFQPAIQYSAVGIILAHNHPSGDPTPSEDDIKVTHQITEVGKVMDIDVLDHIIIGDEQFVSLKEKGEM